MAEIKHLGNNVRMSLKRKRHLKKSTFLYNILFIEMKEDHAMMNTNHRKDIRQRIIESQIDVTTKYFCTTMDKYYQAVITYRERCKERIAHEMQLKGLKRLPFFIIYTLVATSRGGTAEAPVLGT
jgi:hypothetical protein